MESTNAVKHLLDKIASTTQAHEAMQWSQAILNLMHAAQVEKQSK